MKRSVSKNSLFAALFVVMAFGFIAYLSGCKSKCGSVTCQNSGTCSNDTCSCPSGYSGTSCETMWATAYLGSYTCTQTCAPAVGTASWKSTITAATTNGAYTISISNFGNLNITATATVDGNGNVTLVTGDGVAGSGTFANNVLTFHYTTNTNNVSGYTCNLAMNKD